MVCAVSKNLVAKNWHARELFTQVAKVVGGGGGGTDTLASGGGKDASKLPQAFALFEKLVQEKAK
jgi:alanyl-tRNA synthetase